MKNVEWNESHKPHIKTDFSWFNDFFEDASVEHWGAVMLVQYIMKYERNNFLFIRFKLKFVLRFHIKDLSNPYFYFYFFPETIAVKWLLIYFLFKIVYPNIRC